MDRLASTSLLPGRPALWLVVVMTVVLALLLLASTGALGADPPATGDWVVDDTTTLTNQDVVVTGDVIVRNGGSLTLTGGSLSLNMTAHGQYGILVESGGHLVLEGVRDVDSVGGAYRYNITLRGSAFIGNSTIRRMDGPTVPNPLSTPQGLVIPSSSVRLYETIVRDARGFAITVQPGSLADVTPVIESCTIRNNGGGIYCGGMLIATGDPVIKNCRFFSNTIGDVVALAANPTITGCVFGETILSPSVAAVVVMALAEPTISDCTFNWAASAIASVYANPIVRDCTVSNCYAGLTVIGNGPVVERLGISNTVAPVNLTGTFARLTDVSVSGFATLDRAVVIDGGRPEILRLTVDLSLLGSAVSIINDSRAIIRDSDLASTGGLPVVEVDRSTPILRGCTVEGGTDGIHLVWSPATVEDCTILSNSGWGIASYYEEFTGTGNTFGKGGEANGDGRVVQYHLLQLWVEHEDGSPAVDATLSLHDAQGTLVTEVATDPSGFGLEDVVPAFEITNANRTIVYEPYLAEAFLGELSNTTSVDVSDNPILTLVLRSGVDLPPVVRLLSPVEGLEYEVFALGNRVRFHGEGEDPEGGSLAFSWYLDGEPLGTDQLDSEVEVAPGGHEAALMAEDVRGQRTWARVNFTVTSIPPAVNVVNITSPGDGFTVEVGTPVMVACEYYVLDHPELMEPEALPVNWTSSLDGPVLEGDSGEVAGLSVGTHVLTVRVWPRYPEFIPEPYAASVTVHVRAPEPVAVAVIASPTEGAVLPWDGDVTLSAEGSSVVIYDPPDHRVIYRWTSSLDGMLGEGRELTVGDLAEGDHVITLLLTTAPFIVSANATVNITVEAVPNHPPVARITLLTAQPRAGEAVQLTASLSADPDGDVLTYGWDLGDGNTSTLVELDHVYAEAGNYTVTLTIFDGDLEATATLVLDVSPVADGGDGGGGDDGGDGGGSERIEPSDTWKGWLVIVLLFAALGALVFIWYRGRPGEG